MKRLAIFLLAIVIILWVSWYFVAGSTSSVPNKIPFTASQPTPTSVQPVSEPQQIRIPQIGVTAPVESVGLDGQGRMKSPVDYANVAWFNLGYKPGEQGSSVIAGHLDDPRANPAVFWDIKLLKKGDEILVTDKDGHERKFKVTRSEKYEYNKVPLKEIFGKEGKPTLALITCEGNYNQSAHNYSHRYVVYSELE